MQSIRTKLDYWYEGDLWGLLKEEEEEEEKEKEKEKEIYKD